MTITEAIRIAHTEESCSDEQVFEAYWTLNDDKPFNRELDSNDMREWLVRVIVEGDPQPGAKIHEIRIGPCAQRRFAVGGLHL